VVVCMKFFQFSCASKVATIQSSESPWVLGGNFHSGNRQLAAAVWAGRGVRKSNAQNGPGVGSLTLGLSRNALIDATGRS
jgi:hypothetical protein